MAGKVGQRSRYLTDLPRTYGPAGKRKRLHAGSAVGLAYTALRDTLRADLGGDLSAQQEMLVERAVWLHLHARRMELDAAGGTAFEVGAYVAAVNALTAVLTRLGLQRVARPVPDLHAYLASLDNPNVAAPPPSASAGASPTRAPAAARADGAAAEGPAEGKP